MRTLAYIRVSTNEQATEGVSLEAQRAKVEAYAAFRGLELVEVVVDAGVSAGKPLARRPGGARVLAALASGAATCVVACKLDRLFRNTADALTLTEAWNKAGVALHLLDLNVDTSTTMGRFFLSIIAAAAELERSMGADRTRAALEQVKAQGGRLGGEALGWRRLDAVDECGRRVVEAVPEELAAVERAVELRRGGATLQAIAQALNAEGLPTKRGAVWRAGTVRAVLMRVG